MTIETKRKVKIVATALSMAGVITAMGMGCGMSFQPAAIFESADMSSNGFTAPSAGPEVDDVGDLVVVSGQRTAFMPKTTAVLDNMVSITGVPPSNNTRNVFNEKLDSVSETGSVLSTNAPMLFAYMAVAAEVCNDLINAEANIATATDRRFFRNQANLAANRNTASNISDANITDLVARFSRNAWGRNPAAEETSAIIAGVREMLAAPQTSNQQKNDRRVALYVCTSMLASSDAYTF